MMFGTILKALIAPIGLTAIISWSTAGGAQQAAAGTSARSVWDGVYTKQQAERGIELYATHCRSCHGEQLEGNGPAHPLAGPVFTANWDGVSMGDMLERTRTSMPIDKPGSLSRQQVADVLAFVLSANKLPAGEVELPRQAEILNQMRFLATKPSDPLF
jgi:S-disulfanyl-L-cysteine oxidoreductase SoxD